MKMLNGLVTCIAFYVNTCLCLWEIALKCGSLNIGLAGLSGFFMDLLRAVVKFLKQYSQSFQILSLKVFWLCHDLELKNMRGGENHCSFLT